MDVQSILSRHCVSGLADRKSVTRSWHVARAKLIQAEADNLPHLSLAESTVSCLVHSMGLLV